MRLPVPACSAGATVGPHHREPLRQVDRGLRERIRARPGELRLEVLHLGQEPWHELLSDGRIEVLAVALLRKLDAQAWRSAGLEQLEEFGDEGPEGPGTFPRWPAQASRARMRPTPPRREGAVVRVRRTGHLAQPGAQGLSHERRST
jgi:hypothetical protein